MVIGVQNRGDRRGTVRGRYRSFVVASVERVEIESTLGLGFPKPQVVSGLGVASGDHNVVRDGQDLLSASPASTSGAIVQTIRLTIEANIIGDVKTRKLG